VIKDIKYGWESLKLSWQANGISSALLILCTIYEKTIYPLIQVWLLAKLLDTLARVVNFTFSELTQIIGIYIAATFIRILLESYNNAKETYNETKLDGYLDILINKKLSELDPATFENPGFQSLVAQIDGVKGSMGAHVKRMTGLIDALVKFLTAAVVVSSLFPLFIPILILASIPPYIIWHRFRKLTWPFFIEKRSLLTRVTSYIKTLLSSDSTSKEAAIFNTGPVLLEKIKGQQKQYFSGFEKATNPVIMEFIVAKILQFGAFAYTQYLNLAAVMRGFLGIGQFTLVFQQTMNLAFGAEEILNQYSSISVRSKYLDKFFEFMNTTLVVLPPNFPTGIPERPTPPVIEFKNVSFHYPGVTRNILKDFYLKINSGEKIALVGENGAGKTTIIKLLLRFYDVTDGEIVINGINIKYIDLYKWRSEMGALFQDFIKYQFTFKENVELGNIGKHHDQKLLDEAIKKSGADGFAVDLPNKFDQVLGKMFDGGIDLSGGQWQKLALARAFYRDVPFLILDEPTSAIDAKAEYEIFEKVQKLQKDKTVIIISHRFSTVRNADRILVLDEGKIIEEGSHEKLMKKQGLYAELFNLQAQGYK